MVVVGLDHKAWKECLLCEKQTPLKTKTSTNVDNLSEAGETWFAAEMESFRVRKLRNERARALTEYLLSESASIQGLRDLAKSKGLSIPEEVTA